ELNSRMDLDLSVRVLFEHSNVQQLAAHIEQQAGTVIDSGWL
ncbi:phosphopantetheine-binding protein, partial [Rheinheimera sp. WS51]